MPSRALQSLIIGIDFAGPATAAAQRKKIIAIAAEKVSDDHYAVRAGGFNARLTEARSPGWTAAELSDALVDRADVDTQRNRRRVMARYGGPVARDWQLRGTSLARVASRCIVPDAFERTDYAVGGCGRRHGAR